MWRYRSKDKVRIRPDMPQGKALDLMRTGAVLVKMHERTRVSHYVVPGGRVADATADQIEQRPDVVGQRDGLFPQHDQCWRMRDFAEGDQL